MSTLIELQEELALYKDARRKILGGGQSAQLENFTVTRADLKWIDTRIRDLEIRIQIQSNGGRINTQQAVFGGSRG